MKLFSYFRSSASYRVRIALALKGISYDYAPVHLVRREHLQPPLAHLAGDPMVPVLQTDDGLVLTQSMAIMEYLDEVQPAPALLPPGAADRARVRALAQMVACEIHPLNNLRVLRYLVHDMQVPEAQKSAWYRHWVRQGLEAFERQLDMNAVQQSVAGLPPAVYCWGDSPTLADCCLVPQIFNAQRFDVPLDGLPRTMAAWQACIDLPAFAAAHPNQCPDFES